MKKILWQYTFGFHHKSRYHFQNGDFSLENFEKCRCLDAVLRFKRILMKVAVYRFLGSLNPNLVSDFRISKWRIQYGGPNFEKCSELDKIVRSQVFGVAESKSAIKFSKLKIADPIWRTEIWKTREKFDEIVHYYVFGVTESEYVVKFSISKIANPIWRLEWSKRTVTQ